MIIDRVRNSLLANSKDFPILGSTLYGSFEGLLYGFALGISVYALDLVGGTDVTYLFDNIGERLLLQGQFTKNF